MTNTLKLISLVLFSGCTINVITPPATEPSDEPILSTKQPSPTARAQPEELPPNLRPENTGSSSSTTTSTPLSIPTSETTVNNVPRPPIRTPNPLQASPTPEPIAAETPTPNLTQNQNLVAPENLRTSNIEKTSITITWKAATNAEYYRIYQDGILIGDNINQLQYIVQNLSSGQNYEFQVSFVNSKNEESPKSKGLNVGLF